MTRVIPQSDTTSHLSTPLPLATDRRRLIDLLPLEAPVGAVRAAYLHIPFCFHKCHYCDFYSIVDRHDRQEAFVERLIDELAAVSVWTSRLNAARLQAVFVGGGTPTLLQPDLWRRLRAAIASRLSMVGAEFTVEANPETVTPELVSALVDPDHGRPINRVSIGAQSFDPRHLKTLERWHEPANVARSIDRFRAGGIRNINLDLIFAIPGQTVEDWQRDLDAALALRPTHLSCYNLMYEPNTPLTQKLHQGRFDRVDEDVEAAMYQTTIDTLAAAGFDHYEISNWARHDYTRDFRCQHNLAYWHNDNWLALGPSASGHIDGLRWKNLPRLSEYLESRGLPFLTDVERVDADTRRGEQFMLGLRLLDGIPADQMQSLLHADPRRGAIVDQLIDEELLEQDTDGLRLTRRGLFFADAVIARLL